MFIFDCTPIINYEKYNSFLQSLKMDYTVNKKSLFEDFNISNCGSFLSYEFYFEFRERYRNLKYSVIRSVIEKFRHHLPKECLIYLFGSLAKFTERIESDIDLTICYDNLKNELLESVEELINYSIVTVFGHPIDYIHGKFQHYPINHDYDNLTVSDNLYILKFDNNFIEYKCTQESLSENIMNIKNTRSYDELIEGYKEKYALRCDIDCLYPIKILENTTSHDFLGDLAELERKNNIFAEYNYLHKAYSFDSYVEMSYIKRAFKHTIVSMYIYFSYLRRKIKWNKKYTMNMDDIFRSNELREYLGNSYMEKLRACFIKMIFYWDKLELLLNKHNIRLSTKCRAKISLQQLNLMLYNEYNTVNLMDNILASINNLNSVVQCGWRFINDSYE